MKGRLLGSLFALALVAGVACESAEAARVGGGRSMGAQRAAPMQRQAAPPAAAAAPAKQAAPATQPAGNRWLGPLAGLAAGLGLGWLFAQGGFGALASALLMALVAGVVIMLLLRIFARRREAPAAPMQYAGLGSETVAAPPPSQLPFAESAGQPDKSPALETPQIPPGFDVEGFLKHAKRNFVQLQEANDRADLAQLREVATEEMFEALRGDITERGARQQQTEIIMHASLLEVATEGGLHWASVRFSGTLRESPQAAAEPFEEVWNLQKPVSGETGWLLAGIQQLS